MQTLKALVLAAFFFATSLTLHKVVFFKQQNVEPSGLPVDRQLTGVVRSAQQTQVVATGQADQSQGYATVSINTNGSVDEIVRAAMANSNSGNSPQIIVINQPVPVTHVDPGATDYQPTFYEESYPAGVSGPLSSAEIDGLFKLLNSIGAMYDSYYNMLPTDADVKSDGDIDKQALNVLRFYGKVRAFVKTFFQNQAQLTNDLKFVSARLGLIKTGLDNMMEFYGFLNRWAQVKAKMVRYETRDLKFPIYYNEIKGHSEVYESQALAILAASADLAKLATFFEREISEISRREKSDDLLDAVDKFDDVLMFTIHILDLRTNLMRSINTLKANLTAAKDARGNVENVVVNIDQLTVKYAQQDALLKSTNNTIAGKDKWTAKLGSMTLLLAIGMIVA